MPAPRRRAAIPTPEQFFGFRIGADNKLARWDQIVDYMKRSPRATDRVRCRELGKSTNDNPFIALEISAPDTLKNLDRYKQLERKLYFQGGAPTDAERDEIFRAGQGWCSRSPAASTRPRSARRRWPSSWCTGWPPTTRRR